MRKDEGRFLMIVVIAVLCFNFATTALSEIKAITKDATFYPEKKFGKICRIEFDAKKAGTCFLVVKNADGKTVRVVPAEYKKGKNKVDWDGKNSNGTLLAQGEYTATISDGISWDLDKSFGLNGRIGLVAKKTKIENPEECTAKVEGVVAKVLVNGKEFTKVDSFEVSGPYYTLKEGILTISPVAGVKKGDILEISHYFPVYMDNPWDIEVDDAGNLLLLINYKKPGMKYVKGQLLKLSPNGRELDEDFAMDGIISAGTYCQQIDVSDKNQRIYITEHSLHRIGVYSLRTGAPLYKIGGGYGDKTISNTAYPTGAVLDADGKTLFVHSGAVSNFDCAKEGKKGVLRINKKDASYAPIRDTYWGPSLETAKGKGEVYRTDYGARIMKFKDTGKEILKLYHVSIPGSPIGVSVDKDHGVLFAALRTVAGKIAVIRDTGMALEPLTALTDDKLGPIHDVEYHKGFLYVLEDGIEPLGRPLKAMKLQKIHAKGNNRISRYKLKFNPGKDVVKITRK